MKNLKKILSFVVCMAMVLSLASFTAFAEETEHECEWRKIEVAPTCTTYGFDLYVCTIDGCEESYADNYVDAFGHDWVEATCIEKAICNRCGVSEGDFAAHNITSSCEGFAASCLEDGIVEYYYCGDCGVYFADAELTTKLEDQTGASLVIPATGHNIAFSSEGFDASCLEDGIVEFYYCGECCTYFEDAECTIPMEDQSGLNLGIPMTGHNITASCEGFAPSCLEEGMIEYYYCGDCGIYFADAELTTMLEDQTGANLIIPATGHNIAFSSEGFAPSCLEEGMIEFYYCGECGIYFADAEFTTELEDQTGANLVIPATGHNIVISSEGFAPSCLEDGMIEFYYCGDCGTYFADAELTTKLEDQTGANLIIPAAGHNIAFSSEGFGASCVEEGMIEFYYCGECGTYFADAELTTKLEDQTGANLFIPVTGHNITASCEGFEASCLEEGIIEYYYCGDCNTYFADAELTTKLEDQTGANLTIPMTGHNITASNEGFEASCLEEGIVEYYYCGDCGTYFADAELTTKLEDQTGANLTIPKTAHNITSFSEGFAPTTTEEGMLEYYYCGDCCTYFEDAECTKMMADQTGTNLTIPTLSDPADTGDKAIVLFAIFALVAMAGMTVVVSKKKYF